MDDRFARPGIQFRAVRLQPWKVWALAAVGGLVAVAVIAALAGLFLILVPVFLVAGLAARLLLGMRSQPARPRRQPGAPDVIEGRYEIVGVSSAKDVHR